MNMQPETLATTEKRPIHIESDEEIRQRITEDFHALGVECPSQIIDRLFLLEKHSKFYKDSKMIQEGVENVLTSLGKTNEEFRLAPKEKGEAILAALVHDVGKSGLSDKRDSQFAMVRLFGLENIPKEEIRQTVEQTVKKDKNGLGSEISSVMENLAESGVTPATLILEVWKRHAVWTSTILDKSGEVFNENVRKIAASHHIDTGIDPYGIGKDGYPQEHQVSILTLMAVDKYQAILFRNGKRTHAQVMEILLKDLKGYEKNNIMNSIIRVIDDLGKTNKLFTAAER